MAAVPEDQEFDLTAYSAPKGALHAKQTWAAVPEGSEC
jgi:hypothetical protein